MLNTKEVRNKHREKGREDIRRDELRPLQQRHEALQAELTASKQAGARSEAEITTLRQQVANMSGELAQVKANITTATNNIATLNTQKIELENKLRLAEASKTSSNAELASLRNQMATLNQKLLQKQGDINTNNQLTTTLQEQIISLTSQITRTEQSLNTRIQDSANIDKEIKTVTGIIKALHNKYADNTLMNQDEEEESTLAQHIEELDGLIAAKEALAKTFQETAEAVSSLHQSETKASQEYAALMTKRIQKLRTELKLANKDSAKFKKEIISLDVQIENLSTAIEKAFIQRAIKTYIRNMKKIDTHGGNLEAEAIASIFRTNIKIWEIKQNENSCTIISPNIESSHITVSSHIPYGLQYEHIDGDGHCLFNAVVLYLGQTQDFLRNIIAANIENNMVQYHEIIGAINPGRTPEEYLESIRQGTEWADNLEIAILMMVLDRPIVIIGLDGNIRNLPDLYGAGDPIFVHYNGHNHYDALILTGEKESREILENLTQLNENSSAIASEHHSDITSEHHSDIAVDSYLNILTTYSTDTGNTTYQPMLASFTNKQQNIKEYIREIPDDANSLFSACIRAKQLSKTQFNSSESESQSNSEDPINNIYLSIAAYNLRLEACEVLSKNNQELYKIFETLIHQIYAPLEGKALTTQPYLIIQNELLKICDSQRLVDLICRIIGQHYPEIDDERIRATSNAGSISSDSSLGDTGDFMVLGDDDTIELDFNILEQRVDEFFMGSKETKKSSITKPEEQQGIANQYLEEIKQPRNIGGPLELQALAELYNWHIHLKAFMDSNIHGEPDYSNDFKKSNSKSPVESIQIALINATTAKARFILISRAGHNIDSEHQQAYDNIYLSCAVIAGKSGNDLRAEANKHLKKKANARNYRHFTAGKDNDCISQYFANYIFKGYKGVGNEIKEFDLLPISSQLRDRANALRVMRKNTFKVANSIIADFSDKLALEMDEWMHPFGTTQQYNRSQLVPIEGFKHVPSISALLALCGLGTAIANAVLSENFTSTDPRTYETLQGLALASNLVGSIIYCLDNYHKEKNRTSAVRAAQGNLILNLPFDRIDKSSIKLYKESGEDVQACTLNGRIIDNVFLRNEWESGLYTSISFEINAETFFITKNQHIPPKAKTRNNYMGPVIAASMALYIILTAVTIDLSEKQANNNVTNDTDNNSNGTEPAPSSVSPSLTANIFIALSSSLALLTICSSECIGHKRVCEHELHAALLAISKTYARNNGVMPMGLATLLKYFKVDSASADALSITPQMVNIQKSIFNLRQELKMHAENLALQAKELSTPENSGEKRLSDMLKNILREVDSLHIEAIYQDGAIFMGTTESIKKATQEAQRVLKPNAADLISPERRASMMFSAESASKALRKLSGVLKLGVAVENPKDDSKKDKKSGRRPSFWS